MTDVMRKNYHPLSVSQHAFVDEIKHKAQTLHDLLGVVDDPRMRALALTKLEECVMWAVKGITG